MYIPSFFDHLSSVINHYLPRIYQERIYWKRALVIRMYLYVICELSYSGNYSIIGTYPKRKQFGRDVRRETLDIPVLSYRMCGGRGVKRYAE